MTLLELCEPLFLYVCRLNRSSRKGGHHDLSQVRAEIKVILDDVRSKAASDGRLTELHEKTEMVLIFFVDFMIKESTLPFAREWRELAFERKELAGDEKFFDLLDEALADPSAAATERLAVFYTCMGLGFTGIYTGQPEYLRKMMLQCSARIRDKIDSDLMARICPEAYQHVDTSDLVQPPGSKLLGIFITLICLIAVLFVSNIFLFKWSVEDLTNALDAIIKYGK